MKRWGLAIVASLSAIPAASADLGGRIELYSGGQPLRAAEAVDALVYFRPRAPAAAPPAPVTATMTTRRKQFVPRVLAVTAGSTVRFPNEDPILHNVFSTSPDNSFDAGQYHTGPGVAHVFDHAGLVKVYCNVHHSMFGYIVVLDTPHYARPDALGRFELRDLPDGEGELVVFHDRAQPWRQRVLPSMTPELAVRLDLDKRKVPAHKNKFGKPYRRAAHAGGY
jgi:plastocyanin